MSTIAQEDFTFTITVQYDYEPTRTEVANLAKYIARRTTATVISKVTQIESEFIGLWDVVFTFTSTRVQAARALTPQRYPRYAPVHLSVHIPDMHSIYLIANLATNGMINYRDWPLINTSKVA